MSSPQELPNLIRSRIRAGRLPCQIAFGVSAVAGGDALCSCCDQPILFRDIQFDVEIADEENDDTTLLAMHPPCFMAWITEVVRRETKQASGIDSRTVKLANLSEERSCPDPLPNNCRHSVCGCNSDGQHCCAYCSQAITVAEIQYEVECECSVKRMKPVSMHLGCYDAWLAASGGQVVAG